jgi:hypothetical protein
MSNQPKRKIKLLPPYFKLIGLGLIILAFVPAIIMKLNHIQLQQTAKEYFKLFIKGLFLIGLTMVACSRDKKEDKSFARIRVNSLVWAFFMAFGSVIFEPFFYLLFFGSEDHISGTDVVFGLLFYYLTAYYFQKFAKNWKNKILLDLNQSN